MFQVDSEPNLEVRNIGFACTNIRTSGRLHVTSVKFIGEGSNL